MIVKVYIFQKYRMFLNECLVEIIGEIYTFQDVKRNIHDRRNTRRNSKFLEYLLCYRRIRK